MRARLVQREPQMIEEWTRERLYERIREKRKGAPTFILHDGPPYANGPIHLGTALNKVLKDMTNKSRLILGYDVAYVPGWDCHGLPIEKKVEEELHVRKHDVDPLEFRKACRAYAERFINIQREGFIRLGCLGGWDRPYRTMDPAYQATIVRTFGKFYQAGLVYRGRRPVYWCMHDETALAEAEIEYKDHTSPSIYVRFRVRETDAERIFGDSVRSKPVYALIWTTTPWTLPANLALAFHPEYTYVLIERENEFWIVAEDLWFQVKTITASEGKVLKGVQGDVFDRALFYHPFIERESIGILADYVTLEQGTGIVHTAPGHGLEDFLSTREYGLEVLSPVDEKGRFTEDSPVFQGLTVWEANPKIIDLLREKGALVHVEDIVHSYPHCWRCKQPLIYRATEQWFISMNRHGFRERALEAVKTIQWIPAWGEERIEAMIENRPDWCISRQRLWGVPIPQFICKKCGAHLEHDRIFDVVADIFEKESADAWYARPAEELLPEGAQCASCGGKEFEKGMDILDVWFDSGTSHEAVLGTPHYGLTWPADVYLEGTDQYRGWFNSSLLVGVLTRGQAPYRTCITHGFVVDENKQKLSKSLGNYIEPSEITDKLGAEILRGWVAMVDYQEDMSISDTIIQMVATQYRKIRNTIRYLLGNLADFQPEKEKVPVSALLPLDAYMLHRLLEIEKKVVQAYESYQYQHVYHTLLKFCTVELSAFYLDVLKDRLYCEKRESILRKSAQTVLYEIARSLLIMLSPIYSFTAYEAWKYLPPDPEREENVFFETCLPVGRYKIDEDIVTRFERYLEIREIALRKLEEARKQKIIGSSLDAHVRIQFIPPEKWLVDSYEELKEVLMVSSLEYEERDDIELYDVHVSHAKGEKCERCWMWSVTVGEDESYPELCSRCVTVVRSVEETLHV